MRFLIFLNLLSYGIILQINSLKQFPGVTRLHNDKYSWESIFEVFFSSLPLYWNNICIISYIYYTRQTVLRIGKESPAVVIVGWRCCHHCWVAATSKDSVSRATPLHQNSTAVNARPHESFIYSRQTTRAAEQWEIQPHQQTHHKKIITSSCVVNYDDYQLQDRRVPEAIKSPPRTGLKRFKKSLKYFNIICGIV